MLTLCEHVNTGQLCDTSAPKIKMYTFSDMLTSGCNTCGACTNACIYTFHICMPITSHSGVFTCSHLCVNTCEHVGTGVN